MTATVYASTDARDTDWGVMLLDVFPDGHAERVQDGLARARFRQGMDKQVLLTPGSGDFLGAVPQVRPEPQHRWEQRDRFDLGGGTPAVVSRRGAPDASDAAGDPAVTRLKSSSWAKV
jgi:X-Pro dipeptidyl-peptidase C-terminal non-catalytic domain